MSISGEPSSERCRINVSMSGSEWFRSRPGGLNRYFEDLFQAMSELDNVSVTGYAFGDSPQNGNTWGGIGSKLYKRIISSRQVAPAYGDDFISDNHFALYGRQGKKGRRVVHFHGPWAAESRFAQENAIITKIKKFIEKRRYSSSDALIVLSAAFRDVLIRDYSVPADKINIIPPGVDLSKFSASPVQAGSLTVVCVRRLEKRMGISILLEAWEKVVEAVPQARLVIVGRGGEEKALMAQARALGLSDSVSFAGRLSDEELHNSYADAALSVIPTLELEGFGLIALESLAAGRAPIVTNCGGLPESVQGLDPSLIVPAGDVRALAARLIRALNGDIPSWKECREHAERFSWSTAARKHYELYLRMLTNPR